MTRYFPLLHARLSTQNPELRTSYRASLARTEFVCGLSGLTRTISIMVAVVLLVACGQPMFENAGSQHSLLEDRETCVMEIDQSPAAQAYRKNPSDYPDYPNQVFEELTQCIERKGWKQVRSPEEQELVREATRVEIAHSPQPLASSDAKAREAITQAVEDRLAR